MSRAEQLVSCDLKAVETAMDRTKRMEQGVFRAAAWGTVVMTVCLVVGVALGRIALPHHNAAQPGGIFDHLLSWDGRIYYAIMRSGYSWDPVHGMLPGHYQNIEFFPLGPLLDGIVELPFHGAPAAPVVLLTFLYGIVSVFLFARLASELVERSEAIWATLLFAAWPAASFYVMGYPTGLISALIILALLDHVRARYWRSALWCGIATAAAPTMVFVITGLGLDRLRHWLAEGLPVKALPGLVGWGMLCISGIVAFMAYQMFRFGDPLAFAKASAAWGPAPSFSVGLHRLFDSHWYVQQLGAARDEIRQGLAIFDRQGYSVAAMTPITFGIQRCVNLFMMPISLAGLIAVAIRMRGRALAVPFTGFVVLAGYIWFIFLSTQNMIAVPRLMLPAVGLFLGLGMIVTRLGRWAGVVAYVVFCLLTVMEAGFAAAGYWVT